MSELRQPDDRFEAALAKGLRREGDAIEGCPEPETLAAYWDRTLTEAERVGWETHLAQCARCQAQLAGLARTSSVGDEMAVGSEKTARRLGWWLDVRWLAPAASLAAVLLAVWVIRPDMIPEPLSQVVPGPGTRSATRQTDLPAATETAPVEGNLAAALEGQLAGSEGSKARVERLEQEGLASRDQIDRQERVATAPLEETVHMVEEAGREVDEVIGSDDVVDAAQPAPSFRQRVGLADAIEEPEVRVDALQPSNAPVPEAPRRALDRESFAAEAARGAAASADGRLRSDADLGSGVVAMAPSSSVRWRSTGEGAIERSGDGGVTWTVQRPGSAGGRWLDGAASSASSCWFVGAEGVVIRTDDGETWRQVASPTTEDLTTVDAADELTATVTSTSGRRYHTTDGGTTWREP